MVTSKEMKEAISLLQRQINKTNQHFDTTPLEFEISSSSVLTNNKTQERLSSISAQCDAFTRTQARLDDAFINAQVFFWNILLHAVKCQNSTSNFLVVCSVAKVASSIMLQNALSLSGGRLPLGVIPQHSYLKSPSSSQSRYPEYPVAVHNSQGLAVGGMSLPVHALLNSMSAQQASIGLLKAQQLVSPPVANTNSTDAHSSARLKTINQTNGSPPEKSRHAFDFLLKQLPSMTADRSSLSASQLQVQFQRSSQEKGPSLSASHLQAHLQQSSQEKWARAKVQGLAAAGFLPVNSLFPRIAMPKATTASEEVDVASLLTHMRYSRSNVSCSLCT
jgi:hypothetical protein